MRKAHKREMLALFKTMGKMAELLPKLVDPSEQIQDLLVACHCLRENFEQENAPKCLNLLQSIEATVKTDNYPSLYVHIKNLESIFNSEVKIKREAIFLPYKASMWDSMESIYLAAKDDPNWDAFVMPIPYYDKKDGKFTEKHWETSYPKDIPLIDYHKYSIEEQGPDIIFIHNPYDDYNIVTSVHPDFYSRKLRNLTDCLVYVPYFVGSGTDIQEHFCTLPGCIFAHKVIVQTEQERKIYVNVYKEFAKNNKVPERFDQISSKFLALGSPKLDKAVSTKSEGCEIPEEWKKLAGTRKVVFYNTSIGALLENSIVNNRPSNKYLQKVKSVFEFFKKRDDMVLLWRPHPILESTINSMLPWLVKEYAEIVREFKASGYGIYDDGWDLNRAVAFSDVYYGDGSSVAKLFEAADKPVFWQIFTLPAAYISELCYDGNFLWFINRFNVLYKHNRQSRETERIGMVSAQNTFALRKIALSNRKLYFTPYYKNSKIFFFDIDKNKFEQIGFKDDCKYDKKFLKVVCFKNFIYFIPHDFPAIIKLNANTNEMEYFSQWIDELFKLQVSKSQEKGLRNLIFWECCIADMEIALVIHGASSVIFFNAESGRYEIKSIGEKSEQYSNICFDGKYYYLSSLYDGYLVKWNRQSDEILKIEIPSFSRRKSPAPNFLIEYLNGYVWLFPFTANNAYKIDINTNEITELPELVNHFENKNLGWYYNSIFVNEDTIFASTWDKGIAEYNTNTSGLNFIEPSNLEIDALLFNILNCENEFNEKTPAETVNSGKRIWEKFGGMGL